MHARSCALLLLVSAHVLLCATREEKCHASSRFYIYEDAACFYNISSRKVGFPLEFVIYDRLLDHPCRTHDSAAAAAVYVPTFGGAVDDMIGRTPQKQARDVPELVACLAHIDASLRSDPRWLRHKGADFYHAYSRTPDCCSGVQPAMRETALANGWTFIIEPNYVDHLGFSKEMAHNFVMQPWPHAESLQFRHQCFPIASDKRAIGVPYTVPGAADQRAVVALREEANASKRRVLMAAQFGQHGKGAGVRQALMRQCLALPATRCSVLQPRNGVIHVPAFMEEASDLSGTILLEAKFSLQPAGDSPSRGLLWQAIKSGCVPVFFQSCAAGFWKNAYTDFLDPIDGFGLHSWAVLLNSTEAMRNATYVQDELTVISDVKRQAMSAMALSVAPRNTYFTKYDDTMRDAIDVIVDKMTAQKM
jgi:hypothetical protein